VEGSFQNLAISGYNYSNLSSSSVDIGSHEPSLRTVNVYLLAYFFSEGAPGAYPFFWAYVTAEFYCDYSYA